MRSGGLDNDRLTGGAEADSYQPMNVNFGLFPPIEGKTKKKDRKALYTSRAREKLAEWMAAEKDVIPALRRRVKALMRTAPSKV